MEIETKPERKDEQKRPHKWYVSLIAGLAIGFFLGVAATYYISSFSDAFEDYDSMIEARKYLHCREIGLAAYHLGIAKDALRSTPRTAATIGKSLEEQGESELALLVYENGLKSKELSKKTKEELETSVDKLKSQASSLATKKEVCDLVADGLRQEDKKEWSQALARFEKALTLTENEELKNFLKPKIEELKRKIAEDLTVEVE